MERYLEIGACSMLDSSYPTNLSIDKMYHYNKPEVYSDLIKYQNNWYIDFDLSKYSGFIFSQSIRDKEMFNINDISIDYKQLITVNIEQFTNNLWNLLYRLNQYQLYNRTIVLIDSVSVERTYQARPFYAASKSYQAKLFEGMALNNPKQIFVDIRLGSVKTRMCDHGRDASEVADKIFDKLPKYKLSETNYIIDHL